MNIRFYHFLQNMHHTGYDQNYVRVTGTRLNGFSISTISASFFHGQLYVAFFQSSSFDSFAVAV